MAPFCVSNTEKGNRMQQPTGRPGHNRGQKFPPEIVTRHEFIGLVGACNPRYRAGRLNRALLGVLYGSGLRIAEALGLRRHNWDPDARALSVIGKGQRHRVVGIDPFCEKLLQSWVNEHARGWPADVPIFCTRDGGPIWPSQVRTTVKLMAKRAGIARRVHPHGLRHSLAAHLAEEGVPVNLIQQQLGHSSVATTSRYLAHVRPQQVLEAMHRRDVGGGLGSRKPQEG